MLTPAVKGVHILSCRPQHTLGFLFSKATHLWGNEQGLFLARSTKVIPQVLPRSWGQARGLVCHECSSTCRRNLITPVLIRVSPAQQQHFTAAFLSLSENLPTLYHQKGGSCRPHRERWWQERISDFVGVGGCPWGMFVVKT